MDHGFVSIEIRKERCEPVWPGGKGARLVSRRTSVQSTSAALSLNKIVVYGCCLVSVNETLKWLTQLPTLR